MSSATTLVAGNAANHTDCVDEISSNAPTAPSITVATSNVSGGGGNGNMATQVKSIKLSTANADKLGVVLQGYLKKQKTMKKKYFVLVSDNGDKPARLEYYDSEKKCRSRFGHPKRSIVLKSCFHISRRLDTKQKFVIALYTKEDSFCIVLESEMDMSRWLDALQILHRINENVEMPRTTFGEYFVVFVCTARFFFISCVRNGMSERKSTHDVFYFCFVLFLRCCLTNGSTYLCA